LPPDVAINSRGKTQSPKEGSYGAAAPKSKRARSVERLDPADRRAKGKLGQLLSTAQGESVKIALDAAEKPVECDVIVDGNSQGTYKGKSAEHLQRIIALQMEEQGVKGTAEVREKAAPAPEPAAAKTSAGPAAALAEGSTEPVAQVSEQPASSTSE